MEKIAKNYKVLNIINHHGQLSSIVLVIHSEVVKLSEQECLSLGYHPAELYCDTCATLLAKTNDEPLHRECCSDGRGEGDWGHRDRGGSAAGQ